MFGQVLARRAGEILAVFCVIHSLSGCSLESEKPDLALDTPGKYRALHGAADAAVPKLDWWRGFRSRELVSLIEDAQAHNFDIAIAVAQIKQADAQVMIDGAPLFPAISLLGMHRSASRRPRPAAAARAAVVAAPATFIPTP